MNIEENLSVEFPEEVEQEQFNPVVERMKIKNIIQRVSKYIKAPEVCKPSEWVERNLYFPDGPMANQPMKLDNFQKGMIDSINEGKVKIIFMTSAQIGKTTVLNGMLFWKSAIEGGNVGIAQATGKEVSNWLNSKIRPMIEVSPVMKDLVASKADRDKSNNESRIDLMNGGTWFMMSLGSPTHLRGKTLPMILMDEVEGAEESEEGSPINLAAKRATTFQEEARLIICSTPNTQYGPINKEFEASDKRYFMVDCPHCGHNHRITFKECIKFNMIRENSREIPDVDSAVQICPSCKETITDIQRTRMIHNGKWVATNPNSSSIGFHISALYSPRNSVKGIVEEYKQARATMDNKSFYNTVLGEPWSEGNENIELHVVDSLREPIGLENIPDDVMFLTAGVDQQKDRLETTMFGHAKNKIYVLAHKIIHGQNLELHNDPAYKSLYNYIRLPFTTCTGRKLTLARVNMDSGNGRATKVIYSFAQKWNNIKPIKGASKVDAPFIPPKSSKSGGYELWMIGVNEGKNKIRQIITANVNESATPEMELILSDDLPDDYVEQLMSEEVVKTGNARRWVIRKGGGRNECLDTFVYGLAARFQVLNTSNWGFWEKLKDKNEKAEQITQEEIDKSVETGVVNYVDIKPEKPKVQRPQRPQRPRPTTQRRRF